MDSGGFAPCATCREYRWSSDGDQGLCVECHARASAALQDPPPFEPVAIQPDVPTVPRQAKHRKPEPESGRAAKHIRKMVERKYEKGKLGSKPKRPVLARLARTLWDELSPASRDGLAEDLRAHGFCAADPFEALVDFCDVTVLKQRAALKKKKQAKKDKPKMKHTGQPRSSSVRTVRGGLPGLGSR